MNKFFVLVILIFAVMSCGDDGEMQQEIPPIPDDILELGTVIGNRFSDKVIVNTQGGPSYELDDAELDGILRVARPTFPTEYLVFNVHQEQTLNPQNFTADISFDEAKQADQASVDRLARVINYFKGEGKEVDVLGISFGAFMVQDLIVKYGIDIAEDYLIMAGRLDINEDIWMAFSEGGGGGFVDGVETFVTDPSPNASERNLSRLAAGLGFNRYTAHFSGLLDMSAITYVFGTLDERVGRLSDNEQVFLVTRNAIVIVKEGANHDQTIDAISEVFESVF